MLPQLKEENWKTDLIFIIGMLKHLHNLNVMPHE